MENLGLSEKDAQFRNKWRRRMYQHAVILIWVDFVCFCVFVMAQLIETTIYRGSDGLGFTIAQFKCRNVTTSLGNALEVSDFGR